MNGPAMLADHLSDQTDAILAVWRKAVTRNGDIPEAEKLSPKELVDDIPELLSRLNERLRGLPVGAAAEAQKHGRMRWRQGYDIADVVAELGHLRAALLRATFQYARKHRFDPAALEAAIATEAATRAEERAAQETRAAAEGARIKAVHGLDALAADHRRIEALVGRADARGREADQLDLMYREFTRFDQYVAERVTPQLAEHAGELLGAVTEGKYDRVEFDENYGLKIFDDEECFPIAAFFGGERDVAVLCARLAVSRLVGPQATHPPRFLVLDEVFGSLDQDRRSQVLDTLGLLATSSEAFRQLFIISHVEDVRLSATVDEVWRISEVDGVSRFENLTRVGGLVEV